MKISVIVPCYNEEEALPLFLSELLSVSEELKKKYGAQTGIIFVDDGSKDKTSELIQRYASESQNIDYISFSRNFGKESALYAGLSYADGDYVAVMDADLQDPPSLLPQMLSILETENYDCVATRRVNRSGEPVIRSFFAKLFYKLINRISDADIVDGARDFRLMNRKMVDAVISMEEYNRFSKGIFGWVGFNVFWLPYENVERIAGNTRWSFAKLLTYAFDGIVNFSEVPLKLSSWLGLCFTVFSFLMLILIIIRKLIFGDPVAGWASTICVIIFIGGIQLFSIGTTGLYIAKIYSEVKKRPHYIISETSLKKPDSARSSHQISEGLHL